MAKGTAQKVKPKSNPIQSLGNFLGSIYNKPQPQPAPKKTPPNQPIPVPTPFQSPSQGGNPNIVTGTTGQSISQEDRPIATLANGSVLWSSGRTTPKTSVQQASPVKIPYSSSTDPRAENYQPSQPQSGGQQINYAPTGTTPISSEVGQSEAEKFIENGRKFTEDAFAELSKYATSGNPFALDELLANSAAIRNISPYYTEIWDRFKKAIDLDRQFGQGKAQRGLAELQEGGQNYQTKLARLLSLGQQQVGEQFAGQGLYESGGRQRAQGLQNVTAQQDLRSFLSGQQRGEQSVRQAQEGLLNRLLLSQEEKRRELGEAQRYDVESSVQEAQRVAQAGNAIQSLGNAPLRNENLEDYYRKRGETLSRFLPSYG